MRIHSKWLIEANYTDFGRIDEVSDTSNNVFKNGLDVTGYGLSLLGTASSQTGMLYYRIGSTKLDGTQVVFNQTSCAGKGSTVGQTTRCETTLDDAVLTFGLGWEQSLTRSWALRAEYERLHGSGDLTIENAFVGVTYRF